MFCLDQKTTMVVEDMTKNARAYQKKQSISKGPKMCNLQSHISKVVAVFFILEPAAHEFGTSFLSLMGSWGPVGPLGGSSSYLFFFFFFCIWVNRFFFILFFF